MNRIFMILFVLLSFTTFAQVTITQSDISSQLAVGTSFNIHNDTSVTSVDIGSTGQNTWDFSGLTSDFIAQTSNINLSSAPENNTFAEATSVTHSTATIQGITINTWTYHKIESDKVSGYGFHIESSGMFSTSNTSTYSPAETVYKLPLNFGDSWTDTGTRVMKNDVAGFADSSTEDYTITKTVDAWGTLKMPDGTVESVLRVRVENEFTSTVMGSPQTTYNIFYEFISENGLYMEINPANNSQPSSGVTDIEDASWHYGTGATGVKNNYEIATKFTLKQNYPNPFNPTTNIEYSIPKTSNVTLKVYDVLGNEVATLVDNKLSAGVYNVKFDGSNLSSGIYFYTLSSGNFLQTKKLMLVR